MDKQIIEMPGFTLFATFDEEIKSIEVINDMLVVRTAHPKIEAYLMPTYLMEEMDL